MDAFSFLYPREDLAETESNHTLVEDWKLDSWDFKDIGNLFCSDESENRLLSEVTRPIAEDLDHSYLGDQLVGDPYAEMQFFQVQEGMNSCAVASQKEVLESILGKEVPEIELSYMAYKNGWFDPASGTLPQDMGKLLEAFDIPVERGYDREIVDIYQALEHGEKVIVGLNSNEIWSPQYDEQGNPVNQMTAGHAVWVTGLYQDDEGKWFVIMNDTGVPTGQGETVRLEDFLNAWSDFGNFAVITKSQSDEALGEQLSDKLANDHPIAFGGYNYTGPNGEKLYKAGDGHSYDIHGNKVD